MAKKIFKSPFSEVFLDYLLYLKFSVFLNLVQIHISHV